jgi:NAD(P)-dependent dehydrogenase (short-subunit alcohol dehydrogenase family)
MVRACAPAMRDQDASAVVNVASVAGLFGHGSSVAYAASKGAVNALTLSLARALAPHIRVNAIAPAYVQGGLPSRVLDDAAIANVEAHYLKTQALPRLLQTAEIATLAHFLVAMAPGMTGEIVRVDNGLHLYA